MVALAVVMLAGCSAKKALTPEQRAARLPVQNADWRRIGYRWDWKVAPPMALGEAPARTVVSKDLIVFQSTTGDITAHDASGTRIWNTRLANPLTRYTGIVIDGSRVIVSSQAEIFSLDAATGELSLRQRFEKLVNTAPLLYGDLAVVGSNAGELMGHFLATGFKAWGHQMDGPFEQNPVDIGGVAGAVTSRGRVIFVDPVSRRQTALASIFNGPGAPLASGDGRLYVASLDQSLYAFAPTERNYLWRHPTPDPIRAAPVFYSGVVYCSFREAGLTALDAESGDVLWSNPDQRGNVIAVRNGRLIVWNEGILSVVDPQRGARIDSVEIPNVFSITTDGFEDGVIYVTSLDGVIARFVPAS
jgi:outer membrane protein assembly factor BamB